METLFYYEMPIGKIALIENGTSLTGLYFTLPESRRVYEERETPLLQKAAAHLREYLAGERRTFDLPLAPEGTVFQKMVWRALETIPYGETRTYGQIAAQIGNPKASRAVGMANNRNPISIFIPCHRVIGGNGKLVGYGGGLPLKERLLELERQRK